MERLSLRILIVSNEALNASSSNGRTLLKMLVGIPADNIASFCLHGSNDFGICSQCFTVTDQDALQAVIKPKAFSKQKHIHLMNERDVSSNCSQNRNNKVKKVHRSCKNMVIRDFIWRTYRWWTKEFESFIQTFHPNVLLFQAGDAPFMYHICQKTAKKFHLPIVVFNTENYVLKRFMYFSIKRQTFWHWILKKRLSIAYKKLDRQACHFIYATEYLKNEHSKIYHCSSDVIYGSTDMPFLKEIPHENFVVSYIGNLGVGRHEPLIDVAQILLEISPNARLKIFGKFTSENIKDEVCAFPSVEYGGVIPYEQVSLEMQKSDLLLHCENKDRLQDLMGAFSTKIADSIASGIPFLVYADRRFPFVQYLEENRSAFIAENPSELKEIICRCMEDDSFRKKNIETAYVLSKTNHNAKKNSDKMIHILINAVENFK